MVKVNPTNGKEYELKIIRGGGYHDFPKLWDSTGHVFPNLLRIARRGLLNRSKSPRLKRSL